MSSFAIPVPRSAAPLRLVGASVATEYSCRGVEPFGVLRSEEYVPGTGILVRIVVPGWHLAPHGDCGECPACRAKLAPDGKVWTTMLLTRLT